jgi:hypothetical protein
VSVEKPESLGRTSALADASPTRVAKIADQKSIIVERRWYIVLRIKGDER